MAQDCGARLLFLDASTTEACRVIGAGIPRIALDHHAAGEAFSAWLAPQGANPGPVEVEPDWVFNTIYSSGTTGNAKARRSTAPDALDACSARRRVRL